MAHSSSAAADLVALVKDRWEKGSRVLDEERYNYWLNYAFYHGQQWIQWSKARNTVVRHPILDAQDRMFVTVNQIQPRVNHLVGRFTQRNLSFEVTPTAPDDATMRGAKLAEFILKAEHDDYGWGDVRLEAIYNAFFGGVSAVALDWNDDRTPWLTSSGDMTGTGGPILRPLSIAEFCLEPGTRYWREATWWVSCQAYPPEQAREALGLGYTPEADGSNTNLPMRYTLNAARGTATNTDMTLVYTMYERPTAKRPEGRRLVVAGGRLAFAGKWNLPFDELNIQPFRQQALPGRWSGSTCVSAARSPQMVYNHLKSIILEHAKRAGVARLMVPVGSMDDPTILTDEAGEIVPYNGFENQRPHYMEAPEVSRYIFGEVEKAEAELDSVLHTNEVSRGVAPGDRNSGLALSILAERNDSPLSTMAHDQASGWARIGRLVLQMYEAKARDIRKTMVPQDGGVPLVLEWNGSTLQGQHRVNVPLESTSPQSRAALVAQMVELSRSFPQMFESVSPEHLAQMLDTPSSKALAGVGHPDVLRAREENSRLMAGEIPFPERFDDHDLHIREHNVFRKSSKYLALPDELRKTVDAHIEAHQRLVEEELELQANINAIRPGLAGMPQADAPIGSMTAEAEMAALPPGPTTAQPQGVPR